MASVVLLDGPYSGLLRGGYLGGGTLVFLGWVVNTP